MKGRHSFLIFNDTAVSPTRPLPAAYASGEYDLSQQCHSVVVIVGTSDFRFLSCRTDLMV